MQAKNLSSRCSPRRPQATAGRRRLVADAFGRAAAELFLGNTADKTTLRGMLKIIRQRYGAAKHIWGMDSGIPTEVIIAELRATDSDVRYLVSTPNGRLTRYEAVLTKKPSQAVHSQLRVKLLPQDSELDVFAESQARADKERGMRQRKLKIFWKHVRELQTQPPPRDALLKEFDVAQENAGRIATT